MEPQLPTHAPRAHDHRHAPPLRAPGEREVEILVRVLAAVDGDGVAPLAAQVPMLQVDPSSDATCRIYVLPPDAPRAAFAADGRRKLGSFPVRVPNGRTIGEVAVWVEHGLLRVLQYVKYDHATPALVLPSPTWVDLPTRATSEPATPEPTPTPTRTTVPVVVTAGRQAIAGLRAIGAPTMLTAPTGEAPAAARTGRRLLPLVLALVTIVAAVAAFMSGRAGGADVDAARSAGAAAGTSLGAQHGEVAGAFAGMTEGELAGTGSTYQSSFDAARTRVLAAARRAALQRQRAAADAAAAAAATTFLDTSSCPGYRDSNGFWVCT